MAQCFPPLEKIKNLRVPLEVGESFLLDFLLNNLDDTYEIYVQPFLNGDRPDIVIVRKNSGVLIIEVKDWHLFNYKNANGGLSEWRLIENDAIIRSPLAQVEKYKTNLYELHIKNLFENNVKDKRNFSIVQTAVYFHNEQTKKAEDFCVGHNYTNILGYDSLNKHTLNILLERTRLNRQSYLFNQQLYESFCRFLRPPEHSDSEGLDIKYTKRQQELIESRSGVRQKIKGVAGCGKTKILAKRAVNAYSRNKDTVLILTFNITLRNYIHDRISEVKATFPWSSFEISSYHHFFNCQANNYEVEITDLSCFDNEYFFEPVKDKIIRYKAILIDEIQDYRPTWVKLINNYFLELDGELVVFGDEKQNVYGQIMGDDKLPVVPTILGRWNEVKESFRINQELFNISLLFQKKYFAKRYNSDADIEHQQGDLFSSAPIYRYHYAEKISDYDLFVLIRDTIVKLSIHPNDVVILEPTYETIRNIDYYFRHEEHQKTTYIGETKEEFEELNRRFENNRDELKSELNRIRRGRKVHFWANAGTMKISTIHSFKGWEIHTLFLLIRNIGGSESSGFLNELIYTALTRAKSNIIIINSASAYDEFFKSVM